MITRTMTIEEILSGFPEKAQKLAQEITNAGLSCVGCSAATWETLEAGMLGHGFNDEQIDTLAGRLNEILSQKVDASTITITQRAAKKYLAILDEEKKTGWGLSLSDKPSGCSGYEYVLDYQEKAGDEDLTYESEGIEIYVDKKSVGRMVGSEIDYIDGLNGAGFKISNPNVKSSCGCGKSQSY